jgi:hypothetical protein
LLHIRAQLEPDDCHDAFHIKRDCSSHHNFTPPIALRHQLLLPLWRSEYDQRLQTPKKKAGSLQDTSDRYYGINITHIHNVCGAPHSIQ